VWGVKKRRVRENVMPFFGFLEFIYELVKAIKSSFTKSDLTDGDWEAANVEYVNVDDDRHVFGVLKEVSKGIWAFVPDKEGFYRSVLEDYRARSGEDFDIDAKLAELMAETEKTQQQTAKGNKQSEYSF
jgi:hypothetical protein